MRVQKKFRGAIQVDGSPKSQKKGVRSVSPSPLDEPTNYEPANLEHELQTELHDARIANPGTVLVALL